MAIATIFAPHDIFYRRVDALTLPSETLPAMAQRIALTHGIATTTLVNLVQSESGWNPDAIGDRGCSFGLTQQNICANPSVTKEQALDPETSLTIAAEDIATGRESRYTVCNCWAYLSTRIKHLPRMMDIVPNSAPHAGAVAVLYYRDKQGHSVKHVALIEELGEDGFLVSETNFAPCTMGTRWIAWRDPHLAGFWS